MIARYRKRILAVVLILLGVSTAAALALNAFRQNLLFFYSPSQVAAGEAPVGRAFRLGGLVVKGSLQRSEDGLTVRFRVTDTAETVPIVYRGILPDLFREGKGAVAQGRLGPDRVFIADQVLAKHDENYMPAEVAAAVEAADVKKRRSAGGGVRP